jgi:hypothetical protein
MAKLINKLINKFLDIFKGQGMVLACLARLGKARIGFVMLGKVRLG